MNRLTITSSPKGTLRFRPLKDGGTHGSISAQVKLALRNVARAGLQYEIWCHPAAVDVAANGLISLSPHTLHSVQNDRSPTKENRFTAIIATMETEGEQNYSYDLNKYWIANGDGKLLNQNLEKYEELCSEKGIANIAVEPQPSNIFSKRLSLAFTVYEHDIRSGRRIQLGTVFSNYIENRSAVQINYCFSQSIQAGEIVKLRLSDTNHDYRLRMWHIDEENHNATCWRVEDIAPLSDESSIRGNRPSKMSLRTSSKIMLYQIPQFGCPTHGLESGSYTVYIQVYHGEETSKEIEVPYEHSAPMEE